ncbi:MAG: hypothetical protein H7A36_03350 [Chlamydiales bacterium]|nr:hypothetical protein [Chlamydiales bacterium]
MRLRFVIYALILGLFPLFFVGYSYLNQKRAWDHVETQVQKLTLMHELHQKKQAINTLVRKEYAKSDPLFFDKMSRLTFLRKEEEALRHLFSSRSFTGNEVAERRHAFITGGENRLDFVEGNMHDQEGVQECEVSLLHPVEVDADDLKRVIDSIEQPRAEGPQLFFTDFKLARKETPLGSEVFDLNLKILKREYK